MEQFRKQTAIIAVLVVLIACSAYYAKRFNDQSKGVVNNGKEVTETSKTGNSNFFAEARIGRDNQYSTHKQELENIVNNKNSTKQAIEEAQAKLMVLADWADKQNKIEQMAKQRGFEDAICLINENGVELCVKASEALTREQAAQLMDDVVRTTSISPSKIVIKSQK